MPRSKRLRFLSTGRRLILCTLFLCAFCVNAYAQNEEKTKPPVPADISLEFKSNGQLFSSPPELILPGQNISAMVVLDEAFWSARINKVLSSYLKTLENLNNYSTINKIITYGITEAERKEIKGEMALKLVSYIDKTNYIKPELKAFYLNKIKILGITPATISKDYYSPPLAQLIDPIYTITFFYFDKNGIQIDITNKTCIDGSGTTKQLKPCEGNLNNAFLQSEAINVPTDCREIRYELRTENNMNKTIMSWTADRAVIFPTKEYNSLVSNIKDNLNDFFMADFTKITEKIKKLKANPLDESIKLVELRKDIQDQIKITSELKKVPNETPDNSYKAWIKKWLWFTNGIPKINPFDDQSSIFPESPKDKVSAQDKALYEIFDNMVSKQAFQIKDLKLIDSGFKNIPKIKAALAEEAAKQADDPQEYDRLLYKGILRQSSPDHLVYMRHLDVSNNYLIMGLSPKKDITEKERMLILAENKSVPIKHSLSFNSTHIFADDAFFTKEADGTADQPLMKNVNLSGLIDKEIKIRINRLDEVKQIISLASTLYDDVRILRALALPPVLPVFFDHDQSPDYITDNLMHNYLIDPPAVAAYSVKVINADNTEKEVATGSYRINKLYRFRLKAGLLYSFLKKDDYTEISTNNYSLDNSNFGIDGTFGIQTYLTPQDIRSDKYAWRGYLYTGFSMRNISENFYVGLGIEPVSGLAIGLNAHIGKKEALYGNNGVPTAIRKTWAVNFAPSILLDTSLFIKLFSFGTSNKSVLGL